MMKRVLIIDTSILCVWANMAFLWSKVTHAMDHDQSKIALFGRTRARWRSTGSKGYDQGNNKKN